MLSTRCETKQIGDIAEEAAQWDATREPLTVEMPSLVQMK
jgi:hypothetical protein